MASAGRSDFILTVATVQLTSALLLAGFNASGITRLIEPVPTRDHSERMLKAFGARIDVAIGEDGERLISLAGETALEPVHVKVPADPSSAAFLIVAALIVPGSEVRIRSEEHTSELQSLMRISYAGFCLKKKKKQNKKYDKR